MHRLCLSQAHVLGVGGLLGAGLVFKLFSLSVGVNVPQCAGFMLSTAGDRAAHCRPYLGAAGKVLEKLCVDWPLLFPSCRSPHCGECLCGKQTLETLATSK